MLIKTMQAFIAQANSPPSTNVYFTEHSNTWIELFVFNFLQKLLPSVYLCSVKGYDFESREETRIAEAEAI